MLQLGLLVALLCAAVTNLSVLWKQKGALAAPDVDMRHPLRSARDLFRSKWWTIGYLVAFAALLLHIVALSMAPISLVQAVLAGGLVFLAVIATSFFGFKLSKREWWGIGLTTLGLAFLGLTVQAADADAQSHYRLLALVLFEGVLIVAGTLLLFSHRVDSIRHRHGVLMGAATGLLFGVGGVAIKADMTAGILSPWTLVAVGSAAVAFYSAARSLQLSRGITVIATTTVAANVSAILGGFLVFSEPLGANTFMVVTRLVAFALVLVAAALIPEPRARLAVA